MDRRLLTLLTVAIAGCKDPPSDGHAPAPSDSAPAVTAAPKPPPAPSAAPKPLELMAFQLTSGVYEKDPVDDLSSAKPGDRVYAHFKLKNKGEKRMLKLVFKVNGAVRTTLDLKVEPSPSFRTWGFNTLRANDTGELSVTATDDAGAVVAEKTIPIKK